MSEREPGSPRSCLSMSPWVWWNSQPKGPSICHNLRLSLEMFHKRVTCWVQISPSPLCQCPLSWLFCLTPLLAWGWEMVIVGGALCCPLKPFKQPREKLKHRTKKNGLGDKQFPPKTVPLSLYTGRETGRDCACVFLFACVYLCAHVCMCVFGYKRAELILLIGRRFATSLCMSLCNAFCNATVEMTQQSIIQIDSRQFVWLQILRNNRMV